MGIELKQEIGMLRSRMIYNNPVKRMRLHRFYHQWIHPGNLCFDIGAHIGAQSATWLNLGARVVALEPNPRLFRYLQRRFRNKTQIAMHNDAIGEQPGQLALYISSIAPTVSTMSDVNWRTTIHDRSSFDVQWDREHLVNVLTLQQLIDQYGIPDFIKLDVEDYEYQALAGLHTEVPFLSFEYFSYQKEQSTRCIQRLETLGSYVYNVSFREYFTLNYDRWMSAEEILRWVADRDPDAHSGDIYARLTVK